MKKLLLLAALGLGFSSPAQAHAFIAGSKPDQRPAGAPRIQHFVKPPEWYAQALYGVSAPYPASTRFLEAQGAWYTPFTRPGMTGPYDIRGWHKKGAAQ